MANPPPRPPPLPPRAARPLGPPGAPPPPAPAPAAPFPTASIPVPNDDGVMSTRAKMSLADIALALRDEQLQARIVHYKAELETSPELDAVTAQVVAELKALQSSRTSSPSIPAPSADRGQIEIELISAFKAELGSIFREGRVSNAISRKIAEGTKRFARLFFESELAERIRGTSGEQKTIRDGAQGLYHVFSRNEAFFSRQLDAFVYASPEVLADAKARLATITKELRNEFLGSTTPELNALVQHLTAVLTRFFSVELPPQVGELAWEVVKEGRLVDAEGSTGPGGYKITSAAFPRFRATFERKFLQRLVSHVEDGMLEHVRSKAGEFRAETLKFIADPRIFTEVCDLICDAVYDTLYNDGFLDLPGDWRKRLSTEG